jgi:hypothetical protein
MWVYFETAFDSTDSMTDESNWGHGPNEPVPTYFEEQIRMALEDFFDGDHQKVQAVIDHLKRIAEKFQPPDVFL